MSAFFSSTVRCPCCGSMLRLVCNDPTTGTGGSETRPDSPDTAPIHNPNVFAELLSENPLGAAVLLSALTEEQRVWQALAHVHWLAAGGLRVPLEQVLDDWRILEQQRRATARAWAIRDQGSDEGRNKK